MRRFRGCGETGPTSVLRMRECPARPEAAAPSLRAPTRSVRVARSAGTTPNSNAVTSDKPTVNAATRRSTLKSNTTGMGAGSRKLETALAAPAANRKPTPAPASARRKLSVSS
jgi:hypothetical protein